MIAASRRRRPSSRARSATLVVLASAALLAGCSTIVDGTPATGTAATGSSPPSAATMNFQDCTSAIEAQSHKFPAGLSLGCGLLNVPLDYADRSKGTIGLAVLRIHDTADTHPLGSLLVNPGGPGAPGLGAALGVAIQAPAAIREHYDLIGFDPRGVGQSSPVRCLTDKQKDAELAESTDITTAAGFASANRDARRVSADCEHEVGAKLPYFNTVATARDMDRIRAAVGDDKMNYLGFSYGTELGWTYAHLFPDRVRAFVLDGAVDPDQSQIGGLALQVSGFEKAFGQFAASCPAASYCTGLGNAAQDVHAIAGAAARAPLPTGTSRPLTESLAYTGIIEALYSKSQWPKLAAGLEAARAGRGAGLLALADSYNERSPSGSYSNLIDANIVISCNDTPAAEQPSDAQIRAAVPRFIARYPLFGEQQVGSLFSCRGWQPDRTPVPSPAAKTATTVLVLGNINDPATPYQGAKNLTRDLGHARLLTWDGEGHTSFLQGSSCVDDKVEQYLLTLRPPAAGTVCPA